MLYEYIYSHLCRTRDQIVMVNGVSMDNTTSQYTIQHLKSCGKTANIVSTTTHKTSASSATQQPLVSAFLL